MPGESFLSKLLGSGIQITSSSQPAFKESLQLSPVTSVSEAQTYFPFQIKQPARWGNPSWIAATPRQQVSPENATIALNYETPYGPLTLMEQGGSQEVVTIRGGIEASVESSPDGGSMVRWLEEGISYTLVSPKATKEQLLELAERV